MASISYKITSFDNTSIMFRYWQAANAHICVCILHDVMEHSGRYENIGTWLSQKGIAVCSIDYRGHGQSNGIRGHIKSYEKVFGDIQILIQEAYKHFPDAKIILYGQGLGGNFAMSYYLSQEPKLSGIILTSALLSLTNQEITPTLIIGRLLRAAFPFITIGNFIKPTDLSRNTKVSSAYLNDKFVVHRISLGLFFEALNYGRLIAKQGYKVNLPLLIMHGSADRVTDFTTMSDFARYTSSSTTFKNWEGAFHELHNEINNQEVFEFVLNWLHSQFD